MRNIIIEIQSFDNAQHFEKLCLEKIGVKPIDIPDLAYAITKAKLKSGDVTTRFGYTNWKVHTTSNGKKYIYGTGYDISTSIHLHDLGVNAIEVVDVYRNGTKWVLAFNY